MRRLLLVVNAVLLVAIVIWQLRNAFASPETKIRWRLESMVEGFDETRLSPCLEGLAPDYRDTTTGADRPLVKEALIALFFREIDPETKSFRYDADLETLEVDLTDQDPPTAQATFTLAFHERTGPTPQLAWRVRVEAHLTELDQGWALTQTTHDTLAGEMP